MYRWQVGVSFENHDSTEFFAKELGEIKPAVRKLAADRQTTFVQAKAYPLTPMATAVVKNRDAMLLDKSFTWWYYTNGEEQILFDLFLKKK